MFVNWFATYTNFPCGATATADGPLPVTSPGNALAKGEFGIGAGAALLEMLNMEISPGWVPACPSTPALPWLTTNKNFPDGSTARPEGDGEI